MKILVILIVTTVAILDYSNANNLDPITNITDFIKNECYPVQKTVLQTSDGYLLDLIRIPGPPDYSDTWYSSPQEKTGKLVILLMHGLLGSADEFVIGGQPTGLAFKLADRGFDVFMGNVRGSKYGRAHKQLNPDTDSKFWDFCWHDIAVIDLRKIVDYIIQITEQRRMHYIGYNQGNTIFYVLAAELPQYNSNFHKVISVAPLVFTQHGDHPLMLKIRKNLGTTWIDKHIGTSEFSPSKELINEIKTECVKQDIDDEICNNVYFLVNGYSKGMNESLVPQVAAKSPYGIPVKSMVHYAQLFTTDKFLTYVEKQQSDDNQSTDGQDSNIGREYDLDYVIAENYLLYVSKDSWYDKRDMRRLSTWVTNAKLQEFKDYSSNIDLLIGEDVNRNVHDKIFNILQ